MIYFFSATGNSQHVATRIAEALGTQAQSIETASTEIRLADHEPLGFITPTNWNELPVLVREFIQKADIRLAQNNYVFTVATYGFVQGFVCEDARRELKRKGIKMNAGFSVKMPDNWTPMFDLSDPAKVQQQVDAAEPQIDEVIAMIKAGTQGNKSHDRMPYFFRPFTDRLLTYERQTKFFAVDEKACIGCGLCAKKCPVQAIEMHETAKTETNKLGKNPCLDGRTLCFVSRLPPSLPEVCYQLQQQNAIPRAIPAQQVLQKTIIQGTSKLPIYNETEYGNNDFCASGARTVPLRQINNGRSWGHCRYL